MKVQSKYFNAKISFREDHWSLTDALQSLVDAGFTVLGFTEQKEYREDPDDPPGRGWVETFGYSIYYLE